MCYNNCVDFDNTEQEKNRNKKPIEEDELENEYNFVQNKDLEGDLDEGKTAHEFLRLKWMRMQVPVHCLIWFVNNV